MDRPVDANTECCYIFGRITLIHAEISALYITITFWLVISVYFVVVLYILSLLVKCAQLL
jgi:hypothetical protein